MSEIEAILAEMHKMFSAYNIEDTNETRFAYLLGLRNGTAREFKPQAYIGALGTELNRLDTIINS